MPVAAVPSYLGKDFKDASPGMRFGMYLPIWTERADQEREVRRRAEAKSREGEEIAQMLRRDGMDDTISAMRQRQSRPLPGLWDKNDFAAREAWNKVTALSRDDRARMKGLLDRQFASAATLSENSIVCIDALATAPVTTGLGNEHPLENGFAFLNPYGLPYLPGSGVKGVLRQAALELARGEWGDRQGWDEASIDALYGKKSGDGDTDHQSGALSFWDVIPQIKGDSLTVEIMTPHQGHYYQWKKDQRGNEIEISPHESGQPNPISFLTVPPNSRFVFHIQCDLAFLDRLAPDLARNGHWKILLQKAFKHAFEWLGFGAKTAVGYGAMTTKEQAASGQTDTTGNQKPEAIGRLASAIPSPQTLDTVWSAATLLYNPGSGEIKASFQGKNTAALKGQQADALRAALGERAGRLKKNKELKNVAVRVGIDGNMITLLGLATPEQ